METPEEVQDALNFEAYEPEGPVTDPDAELEAAEDVSAFDQETSEAEDLVVAEAPPPPLAKSWAFDFGAGKFFYVGQRGPTTTWGATTLRYWIEKCLMTERGGSPVHDDAYGIDGLAELFGEPRGVVIAGLKERVADALSFHPRISDVQDFEVVVDNDSEVLQVSFTVLTDEDDELTVQGLTLRAEGEV